MSNEVIRALLKIPHRSKIASAVVGCSSIASACAWLTRLGVSHIPQVIVKEVSSVQRLCVDCCAVSYLVVVLFYDVPNLSSPAAQLSAIEAVRSRMAERSFAIPLAPQKRHDNLQKKALA
mmetsp:Transcript_29158/g.44037  ORF Transcript_29158/g.44037 Transcript_29158/m.44037 type:complete len:120 (+) Transcript_29158:383-742(+)